MKKLRVLPDLKLQNNKDKSFTIIVLTGLYLVVVVKNAWISDDAYITFRTIDNFINGYGLVWNTMERVQAYTHPLWMFLLSAFYFFTGEIYYTSIFVSISLSLMAILVLTFKVSTSLLGSLFSLIILIFSNAFIDYSTSGLENPLTHLILAVFAGFYFTHKLNIITFFWLSVIACLGTLNRLDTILLFLPIIGYAILKLRDIRVLYVILIAFLPIILWEFFSVFYYGFPFPNTAYAKLNTGLTGIELSNQGVLYLLDSVEGDVLTPLVIFIGIILPFLDKEQCNIPFCMSIVFYLLYTVGIGGDFMSGRFFVAPLFCAVILVSRHNFSIRQSTLFFMIIIFVGVLNPESPILTNKESAVREIPHTGIVDEQKYYFNNTGLLTSNRFNRLRPQGTRTPTTPSIICGGLGGRGFFAGPQVDIIDYCALSDPLLARLPPTYDPNWRIGHYVRKIPEGYVETRVSGENQLQDKKLAIYYDKLSLITQGDLFDFERFVEILYMNLGGYDHLINFYRYRYPDMRKMKLSEIVDNSPIITSDDGIQVDLEGIYHLSYLILGLNSDYLKIVYFQKDNKIGTQIISSPYIEFGYRVFTVVNVPLDIAQQGYTSVMIVPLRGDSYRLSSFELVDLDTVEPVNLLWMYYYIYYRSNIISKADSQLDEIMSKLQEIPLKEWSNVSLEEWIDLQYVKNTYIQSLAEKHVKALPRNIDKEFVTMRGEIIHILGFTVQYLPEYKGYGVSLYFQPLEQINGNFTIMLQFDEYDTIEFVSEIRDMRLWAPNVIYKSSHVFQVPDGSYDYSLRLTPEGGDSIDGSILLSSER